MSAEAELAANTHASEADQPKKDAILLLNGTCLLVSREIGCSLPPAPGEAYTALPGRSGRQFNKHH